MSSWVMDEDIRQLPPEDQALVRAMMDYGGAFMRGASAEELQPLRRIWWREFRGRWPERLWPQGTQLPARPDSRSRLPGKPTPMNKFRQISPQWGEGS